MQVRIPELLEEIWDARGHNFNVRIIAFELLSINPGVLHNLCFLWRSG